MKDEAIKSLQKRVRQLEWRLHLLCAAVVLVVCLLTGMILTLSSVTAQEPTVAIIRARGLIILDEQGRERIFVGAPVPDPKEGTRRSPSTGLVINDPSGHERFGLGLTEDGGMGMGFDAPPGTGDPRNRERINITADATGGAYIRFLNRKTFVPGRLVLDGRDQFYLEFLDFPEGKVIQRRLSFKGEETVEQKR
jgi:hypothetical protein